MPGKETITGVLKDQISSATRKAWLNPSSNNLGILGMIYHSCEYYDRAAECYRLAVKRNDSKWMWSYYLGYLNREMGEPRDYNIGIQLLERLMIHKACPAEIKISAGKNLAKACYLTGQREHALSCLRYIIDFAGNYNAPREVFIEPEELLKELNLSSLSL